MEIQVLTGKQIVPYTPQLAQLRIDLFRSYPYLYEGDMAYEKSYLQTYTDCAHSTLIIVLDHSQVVGASTAIPLEYETEACIKPFLDNNLNPKEVFYFGESLLLPEYRGQHIYQHFFKHRELAALSYGSKMAAFCAVERASNDPRKPEGYKELTPVWQHFGYQKQAKLCAYFEWKELGETEETAKPLIFWTKLLARQEQ